MLVAVLVRFTCVHCSSQCSVFQPIMGKVFTQYRGVTFSC